MEGGEVLGKGVVFYSQWRTRKEDFSEGDVPIPEVTAQASDRRTGEVQPHREILPNCLVFWFRGMMKKRTVDSPQEGPRKSSIWVSWGSLYWEYKVDIFNGLSQYLRHLVSSSVSELGDVRERQGHRQKPPPPPSRINYSYTWGFLCVRVEPGELQWLSSKLWHSATKAEEAENRRTREIEDTGRAKKIV